MSADSSFDDVGSVNLLVLIEHTMARSRCTMHNDESENCALHFWLMYRLSLLKSIIFLFC